MRRSQRLCRVDDAGRNPGIIRPRVELIEHTIGVGDKRVLPTRRTHAELEASANRAVGRRIPVWLRTACSVMYAYRLSALWRIWTEQGRDISSLSFEKRKGLKVSCFAQLIRRINYASSTTRNSGVELGARRECEGPESVCRCPQPQ